MSKQRLCYYVPIDSYVDGEGFRASIVKEGESGHYPTGTWPYTGAVGEARPHFWGHDLDNAQAAADRANERMGLSKSDVSEILLSSIATPG